MKIAAKYVGGVLLAALLFWVVFRGQDLHAVARALAGASVAGLAAGSLLMLAHNVFRVLRWRALLEPVASDVRLRPMFTAVILGYMTSWVIPGRMGELVRPALLSGREGVPRGPCLGSVVADRVMDGVAILVLFAVGSFLSPLRGEAAAHATQIRSTAVVMVLAMVVGLGTLVAASAAGERVTVWLNRRNRAVAWIGRSLMAISAGAASLRRPRLLARVLIHSLLAWITIAAGTWLGVLASGARVSYWAILVILPLLAFGIALPTPGGAGGYNAAVTFGLMLFATPQPVAVSAGILLWLAVTVPVIVLGLILLKVDRISWRHLLVAARQVRVLGARPQQGALRSTGGTL